MLSSLNDPTLTPQQATSHLARQLPGYVDVWLSQADGSVNVAFYDAPDAQALLDVLNAGSPQSISRHATVIDARLQHLHFAFADFRRASFFGSVLNLAVVGNSGFAWPA